MKFTRNNGNNAAGFTLVEVVLAIGVLSVAVLALLGMFTPTMNNVQNVINSDFAVSSTGSISAYFQRTALNNFDDVKDLVTSASETTPGDTFLYIYVRKDNQMEDIFITTSKEELRSDLVKGNMSGGLLRVEIYKMVSDYDYGNIDKEAYIPMMLKIYAPEPSNPEVSGGLLITYPEIVTR